VLNSLKAWVSNYRAKKRRNKRIKEAILEGSVHPLREFVYLDEVSVYSLLASRKGPIASEYTDTASTARSREVSGTIGVSVGVANAEAATTLGGSGTQSTQVVRKSTIQAAFKELVEGEIMRLAISPHAHGVSAPRPTAWSELFGHIEESDPLFGWVVDTSKLRRGQLAEFNVILECESIFKATSAIASMVAIIEQNPELFPPTNFGDLKEVASINRVLDHLLAGLVPIRGTVIDHSVVVHLQQRRIVHNDVIGGLAKDPAYQICPLFVVGVSEERLYWKDLRRVLYSSLTFRVMCRLNHADLRETWEPVKLADVLSNFVPSLPEDMRDLNHMFEMNVPQATREDAKQEVMRDALTRYAALLAAEYNIVLDDQDLLSVGVPSPEQCMSYKSTAARREAFRGIADDLTARFSIEIDPERALVLRNQAATEAGISPDGSFASPLGQPKRDRLPSQEVLLDTEFVGIYW
jgi:hypothetical protein